MEGIRLSRQAVLIELDLYVIDENKILIGNIFIHIHSDQFGIKLG